MRNGIRGIHRLIAASRKRNLLLLTIREDGEREGKSDSDEKGTEEEIGKNRRSLWKSLLRNEGLIEGETRIVFDLLQADDAWKSRVH